MSVDSYEATMDQINRAITSKVVDVSAFDQDQMKKVSEEIKFQIQNFLRPLSHRLWIDSFGDIRTGNPKEILRDALIELRFSKKFIVCYQFFIGIFGISITVGLTNGIVKSFIATSASLLLFSLFDRFRHRMQVQSAASSITLLLLVGTIPGFTSEAICLLMNRPSDFLASAIIGPALPAIIFLSAVYGIVSRDKEFALSAAKSIRQIEANDFGIDSQSKKSRELSEYLHNSLQSELLRISKQLELNEDPGKTSILLDELNLALSRTRAEIDDLRSKGLERLSAVCLAWEGIAAVQLETLDLGEIDEMRLGKVASVVEEIISNSIRYGNSDEVSIRLVGRGIFVDVSVSHNGTGIVTAGEGLGSVSILLNSETIPVLTKNKIGVTLELTI
jgi:signal transduction histidine kinase